MTRLIPAESILTPPLKMPFAIALMKMPSQKMTASRIQPPYARAQGRGGLRMVKAAMMKKMGAESERPSRGTSMKGSTM